MLLECCLPFTVDQLDSSQLIWDRITTHLVKQLAAACGCPQTFPHFHAHCGVMPCWQKTQCSNAKLGDHGNCSALSIYDVTHVVWVLNFKEVSDNSHQEKKLILKWEIIVIMGRHQQEEEAVAAIEEVPNLLEAATSIRTRYLSEDYHGRRQKNHYVGISNNTVRHREIQYVQSRVWAIS